MNTQSITLVPQKPSYIENGPVDPGWLKQHPRNARLIRAAKHYIRVAERKIELAHRLSDFKAGSPGEQRATKAYVAACLRYDHARIALETIIAEVAEL